MDARIKQVEHPGESWLDFRIEDVPYSRMVEILGEPNSESDPNKVDAEWVVVPKDCISPEIEEGQHLIIWNYKNGPNYGCGPLANISSWSAFGNQELAYRLFGAAHVPPVVPA